MGNEEASEVGKPGHFLKWLTHFLTGLSRDFVYESNPIKMKPYSARVTKSESFVPRRFPQPARRGPLLNSCFARRTFRPWIALILALVWSLYPMVQATPEVSILQDGRSSVFDQGLAMDVTLMGNHLVVALDGGVAVFDSQDPAHLRAVGGISLPANCVSVTVSGSLAYVVGLPGGLFIVDLTDPAHPVLRGSVGTRGEAREVVVVGGYAYVADDSVGLQVIDVSDPSQPRRVATLPDQFSGTHGLAISGTYAYLAAGPYGIVVVDITDPTKPVRVASLFLPGGAVARKIALSGVTAWVASGIGLVAVDVSDPSNPVQVGRVDISGYLDAVTVAGPYVYISSEFGDFQIFDGVVAANPVFKGSLAVFGQAVVAGTNAYIANREGGVVVAAVGNPIQPQITSTTTTIGEAVALEPVGNLTYVANFLAGMAVVNTSDPEHPQVVATHPGPRVTGIALANSLAYLATEFEGLQVLDVSDPLDPKFVGQQDLGRTNVSFGVTVNGTVVYVSTSRGIEVVNVSNPAAPVRVGGVGLRGPGNGMALSGNRLYVAQSFPGGLEILDVSDPAQPKLLGGFYDTLGGARNVVVAGDRAYLADGYAGGVQILNVSNPAQPVRLGRFDTPGAAWGVTLVGSRLYVADGEAGILIADVSDPARVIIESSFPSGRFAREVAVTDNGLQVAASRSGLFVVSTVPGLQMGLRVTSSTPGTPCVLFDADSLGPATWTPRYTNTAPAGPFHFIDYQATSAIAPRRFYRASQP